MKHFENIKKKLSGEMNKQEADRFNYELSTNPTLAKEYKQQQMEERILKQAARQQILSNVKKNAVSAMLAEADKPSAVVRKLNPWRRVLSIAAGLGLLIVAAFVLQNMLTDTPEQIGQNFYQKYGPNFSNTKAIKDDTSNSFQKHIELLKFDDPQKIQIAIDYFEGEKEKSVDAWYYLGHGYFKIGGYSKASVCFDSFIQKSSADNRLKSSAEFYKAINLVAWGNVGLAKVYIEEMKGGHRFERQLGELMENVKNK